MVFFIHVGIKNVNKLQIFLILFYALGKNASLLRFSQVFAPVFAHKPYQNATPTHSVIWAEMYTYMCLSVGICMNAIYM